MNPHASKAWWRRPMFDGYAPSPIELAVALIAAGIVVFLIHLVG